MASRNRSYNSALSDDTDGAPARCVLDLDDNRLLPDLFGEGAAHLRLLEKMLNIRAVQRGNRLQLRGEENACARAKSLLLTLYARLQAGDTISAADVKAGALMAVDGANSLSLKLPRREIRPFTAHQREYLQALVDCPMVFALGPAGTGKTFLAVAVAVQALLAGRIERIILSRPALEAGERLGFLPGDMRDKIDPYLRPLYDALYEMLPPEQLTRRLATGQIEIAPLAFMRGRTLSHAFIILDEAQNVTSGQMKMCLTRLGEGSRMAIAGDASQTDLPAGVHSGLAQSVEILKDIAPIAFVHFDEGDIVRHDLVAAIVKAYDAHASGRHDAHASRGNDAHASRREAHAPRGAVGNGRH